MYHRADTVVTNHQDREDEKSHVNNALAKCGYPNWALEKATKPKTHKTSNVGDKRPNKGHVVLPYIKGTSEAIRRTFSNYGVSVFFKPTRTLRQILVSPKDKTDKKDITGPVYYIPCQGKTVTGTGQCKEAYIGETERSLKTRFNEHRRPSSTASEVSNHIHIESPGHSVDLDKVRILDRDNRWFQRGVKEAVHIKANQPSLNKDGGRFKLSGVYESVIRSKVKKIAT